MIRLQKWGSLSKATLVLGMLLCLAMTENLIPWNRLFQIEIFAFLRNNTLNTTGCSPSRQNDSKVGSRNAAVIVEWRKHANFISAVKSVCPHLDDAWDLLVFCAPANMSSDHCDWTREALYSSACNTLGKRMVIQESSGNWMFPGSNRHLRNATFWKGLHHDHILIFHSDSALCRNPQHSLNFYLQFSYVGAAWNSDDIFRAAMHGEQAGIDLKLIERKTGLQNRVRVTNGNGGFSLRNRELMIRCLDEFSFQEPEDYFFSACAQVWSRELAAPVVAARFFSWETGFPVKGVLGTHGVCTYNRKAGCDQQGVMKQFLSYCPEASFLFPDGKCPGCESSTPRKFSIYAPHGDFLFTGLKPEIFSSNKSTPISGNY
jgi:hypothetical protein